MTKWGATKAKAHFSAVLDKAETEGPQLIERRKKRFLIVTEEQFNDGRPDSMAHKPFVSAWDLLRPPDDLLFDFDFPRASGKVRAAKL